MLRHKLVCSFVLMVLGAASASAQSAEQDDATTMSRLLVTGSRLQGKLEAGEPVTVINRSVLAQSSQRSLGALLQALPFMSGAPLGTSVNARGSGGGLSRGIETVELRGLGAERSLVLVNGRRFLPGGNGVGGLVDLAMIPVAMIERIEILKTGASVEYGADAVAGVINVITRQSEVGLQIQADAGLSERGDGESAHVSAVYGQEYATGHFLTGLDVFNQAAVSKADRAFSRRLLTTEGPDNQIVAGGSAAPPNGNFRTSNGRLTLIDGEDGDVASDFRPWIGSGENNDRYNFNPFEDLRQDARRVSLFSLFAHDVSEHVQLLGEANWQQRDSDTRLASLPFFSNRLDGVSVSANNVYNPFGEDIRDARRRLVEAGPRGFVQDNQAWRVFLGLQGDWHRWQWDLGYAYGRNKLSQRQRGDLIRDRLALALGESFIDASNTPRCGSASAVIAECVPLNLFGGPGSIDQAMLDYVSAPQLRDAASNEQRVFSANVSGDLFELAAGPLRSAFGYEYRRESAVEVPAALTQAGNTTGAARSVTRGQFDSHEIYSEFGLPLWRRNEQSLDWELGARLVEFSNFDRAEVYDTSLVYTPWQGLHLRAAYAKAFRAPTIGELFGGLSQSNPAIDDPCADFSQLSTLERERCVAQGVPADGSFNQNGNETPQLGGGNPDLRPEDSKVLTAGLSWKPAQLPRLQINLDYYRIRITDSIASLGANTVLSQCLATGAAQFCDRISRNPDGEITEVRSELQNIAAESAEGLDLELRYRHPLKLGELRHSLFANYVMDRDVVAFPGAEAFVGAGEFDPDKFGAIPRFKASYRLNWGVSNWDVAYQLQWIGELKERGGEVFAGTVRRVPKRLYHDVNLRWEALSQLSLNLNVSNLTDQDPPFLANADVANTDVSTYRLLGRSYRLGLEYHF